MRHSSRDICTFVLQSYSSGSFFANASVPLRTCAKLTGFLRPCFQPYFLLPSCQCRPCCFRLLLCCWLGITAYQRVGGGRATVCWHDAWCFRTRGCETFARCQHSIFCDISIFSLSASLVQVGKSWLRPSTINREYPSASWGPWLNTET